MTQNTRKVPDPGKLSKGRKPQSRSRITNGKDLLPGIDMRSTWARRMKDLCELHADDLGGADYLSEGQRSLLRRISVLEVESEYIEAAFAKREASKHQYDIYLRVTGMLKRLYDLVGIQRVARDVTPTLADVLRQHEDSE